MRSSAGTQLAESVIFTPEQRARESPAQAPQDAQHWYKYFRAFLGPDARISPKVDAKEVLADDESTLRSWQKVSGSEDGGNGASQLFGRRNFVVKVSGATAAEDNGVWFVKMEPDVRNGAVEFYINTLLRKRADVLPGFHTAKYAWKGRMSSFEADESHFMAVRFLHAVSFARYLQDPETTACGRLSDAQLMAGLLSLLETFCIVDPHLTLTDTGVHFWHRDLKPDSILMELLDDGSIRWAIIDFGLSEVHHYNDAGYLEKVIHRAGRTTPTGVWRDEVGRLLSDIASCLADARLRTEVMRHLRALREAKLFSDRVHDLISDLARRADAA
uniref:Protein kinase domain-containing protein n=1 Tax=Sexangularia sp. CB-2014 TaxID=1486929 RepID=A0A7S1V4T7_9EUKA|mmetsp:Transcript_10528/g.33357  ORF Transcript_10528/g.33357 Transcript_10528/m.33357 type:complete len:330 (+) Transcript_10528:265-1254(+)